MAQVHAQNPEVISTSPVNSATGVSLTTTIDVSVNYPIVLSKLDSVVPSRNFLNQRYSAIYLVDKLFFDSLQGNIRKLRRVAKSGNISITNDSTVRLTLNQSILKPGKQYVVLVDSLHVRTPNGNGFDTVVVSQHTFTFSTVPPTYAVVWSNFEDKHYINCRDTLKVFFNRKLSSHTTDSGSIVTIKKLQSRTYQDSILFSNNYVASSCTSWLSSDSMAIYAIPSYLNDDTAYYAVVNTHYLTGNTDDNKSYSYRKAPHATVYPSVSIQNSLLAVPEELKIFVGDRTSSVKAGDTLRLKAPATYDNLYFKKWESQTIPSINNLTSSSVSTVINCGMLKNLDYKAVYSKMTLDTVVLTSISNFVPTSNNGNAKLVVSGFADSLGNGVYTVVRRPNSFLTITVVHDSGFVFNGWTSLNYPPVNGSTANMIVFYPGTNYMVWGNRFNIGNGGFGTVTYLPCDDYRVTVTANGEKVKKQPADVNVMVSAPTLAGNGPYSAQTVVINSQPFTQSVAFTVTDPCVEIQSIFIDGVLRAGNTSGKPTGMDGWGPTGIRAEDPCQREVVVTLQKVKHILTIEFQTSDQTKIRKAIHTITRVPQGKLIKTYPSDPLTGYFKIDVEYECGDVVDLTPNIPTDFAGIVLLDEWYCDIDYTCDQVVDPNKLILRFTMDEDRKVRFLWKEDFNLQGINVYTNPGGIGGNQFTNFEVNKAGAVIEAAKFGEEIAAIKEFSPNAPVLQFQFSHDADLSTLSGTNPNNAGLFMTDEEGILNPVTGIDEATNCHELATYYYNQGPKTRRINPGLYEMDMVTGANGSIKLWKAMKIEIFWTDRIKRLNTNSTLKNPGSSVTQTILPEVKVEVIDFKLLNYAGSGDDDPALYVTGGFFNVSTGGLVEQSGIDYKSYRLGLWENVGKDQTRSINSEFDQFKPISRKDRFAIAFVASDTYCGDDVENNSNFYEQFNTMMMEKIKNTTYSTLDQKLADFGALFLNKILEVSDAWFCDDEIYGGEIQRIANFGDEMWMGRTCGNNPFNETTHTVSNHHYEVRFKIKLK